VDATGTAGTHALMTMTTIPTSSGTTTLCVFSPRPALGNPSPKASMTATMRLTRPIPARMPSAEPTTPMSAASTRTEPVSCGRDMPSARSRANSRVRWPTSMENVLEMMNVPTSRAMSPKARRM